MCQRDQLDAAVRLRGLRKISIARMHNEAQPVANVPALGLERHPSDGQPFQVNAFDRNSPFRDLRKRSSNLADATVIPSWP